MKLSARFIAVLLLSLGLASPGFARKLDDDQGFVDAFRPGGRPGGGFPGPRPLPGPGPRPIPGPGPRPIPGPFPRPVPGPGPFPGPRPFPRPIPVPFPVPLPVPYPVPAPAPYPVPAPVPVPVPVPQPTQYQCYAQPADASAQWSGGMSVDLNAASANAVQVCQQQSGQTCQTVRCEQY